MFPPDFFAVEFFVPTYFPPGAGVTPPSGGGAAGGVLYPLTDLLSPIPDPVEEDDAEELLALGVL